MNPSLARVAGEAGLTRSRQSLSSSTHAVSWSGSASHINLLSKSHSSAASRGGSKSSLAFVGASKASLATIDYVDGKKVVVEEDGAVLPIGRITWPLAITAAITIFGSSFPHGWNTGVLNAPMYLITGFLNESFAERTGSVPQTSALDVLWATTVSVYLIGGCAGAFSVSWLSNRFGRKKALLLCHVFGFVSAILFGFCQMANSFEMLILARLIVGYGCGAGSGLVPMYLTEIAPVNLRGAMGVLHQFALTCGIMFSQVFGMRQVLGQENLWPILLAITFVPCLISLIVLPWFPDSPRFLLINRGNDKAAESALKKFRGRDDVDLDMQEMQFEYEQQKTEERWTWKQLFTSKSTRMPLLLLCATACCQQLSGINVVFYYSASVFANSGIPADKIQYAVLGTGIVNVCMTGISVPLMEVSGRRPLLLGGMIVMVVASTLLTVALNLQATILWMNYVSIICIIAFVIGFAIGLGSIPQFIGAELFKQGPRPLALSFAGLLNWLCNFIVGITYPTMQRAMQAYSFIPFIVVVLVFLVLLWWKLPETKNKTHEEIYKLFSEEEEKDKAAEEALMPLKNGKTAETAFVPNGHPTSVSNDSASLLKKSATNASV